MLKIFLCKFLPKTFFNSCIEINGDELLFRLSVIYLTVKYSSVFNPLTRCISIRGVNRVNDARN